LAVEIDEEGVLIPKLTTLLVATILLATGACHRGEQAEADNLAHAAASQATLARHPAPTPLPPEEALAAAFAVAFPKGGLIGKTDKQLQFVARDLAPLAGGERVAVLADGTGVGLNTCHPCTGKLRITYVRRQGTGFTPIEPPIVRTIEGNGFGGPPDWKLDTTGPVPIVTLDAGYTGQGCTVTQTSVWRLEPDGVVEERAAARRSEEGC
jgi:hypothetical protein